MKGVNARHFSHFDAERCSEYGAMQLEAPPVDDEDYRKQRALSDIREPYRSAVPLPSLSHH